MSPLVLLKNAGVIKIQSKASAMAEKCLIHMCVCPLSDVIQSPGGMVSAYPVFSEGELVRLQGQRGWTMVHSLSFGGARTEYAQEDDGKMYCGGL